MSDLVGNPEDRFSHNEAKILSVNANNNIRFHAVRCNLTSSAKTRAKKLTGPYRLLGGSFRTIQFTLTSLQILKKRFLPKHFSLNSLCNIITNFLKDVGLFPICSESSVRIS